MSHHEKYAAYITFTRHPFAQSILYTATASSREEAVQRCQFAANQDGWYKPEFWQWWRLNDSKEPYVSIKGW